jgi:hypothetical protein
MRVQPARIRQLPLPSPATGPARPAIPDHPAYQQILTALADADMPMRARDLCQALDLPVLPKNSRNRRPDRRR